MRWYEYKMEADDLRAPDDLKAKLLAMADALPQEEKNRPMMKAPEAAQAPRPVQASPKKKTIRFPFRQVGTLAACLAVCVIGYGALATGKVDLGAKSSSPAAYSSAAAGQSVLRSAADTADAAPELAAYGTDSLSADNGVATLSAEDASAAEGSRTSTGSKIIYTTNLTLESKNYDDARAALDSALSDADGYLESSSEYTSDDSSRSVSLTLRVPQDNYDRFLEAAAQAGKVTYKSQQADDVTTQYMDVETRLSNLEAQRTRLQELQAQADNLSDLLQIETSLTDVQSQIESWQSQLDWYSNQVQQCTVYVNLSEVQNYTPTDESFLGSVGAAFAQGWSNFVNGLQQLAVWLAGAWPVVLVVAAAAAGFAVWRKKRKK